MVYDDYETRWYKYCSRACMACSRVGRHGTAVDILSLFAYSLRCRLCARGGLRDAPILNLYIACIRDIVAMVEL